MGIALGQKVVSPKYGWVVLLVTYLAGISAPANMAKVTALAPVVSRVFGFEINIISWVIALFFLLGIILAFPVAKFIRRLGLRKVISIALLCGVAGSFLGVITTNFWTFMISRVLEGCGFAIMGVAGVAAIVPWFSKEKRGLPIGIWATFVVIPMLVCPTLYGAISESYGVLNPMEASMESLNSTVTTIWWGTFVFDIIILIIFNIFYRDAPKEILYTKEVSEAAATEKLQLSSVLKNKLLWALGLIFLFDEMAFMAINGLFSTYLTGGSVAAPSPIKIDLLPATMWVSASALTGAVFAPVFGKLSDIFKTRKWILLIALCGGVGYVSLVFTSSNINLYAMIVIIGGCAGGGVPSMIFAAAPETVALPKLVPTATALIAFMQNLGIFIGSIAVGNVVLNFGWVTASYTVLVPCYVICIIIFIIGLRKKLR